MNEDIMPLYKRANQFCLENGFESEMDWARRVNFSECTPIRFFSEYVWTVLNSGFRYAVASKFYKRFIGSGCSPETCQVDTLMRNKGKRKAISEAQEHYKQWFQKLRELPDATRLEFLDSLPFIGPVTKYHLARNLGLDYAKPDVHLARLAKRYGFDDVNEMCATIASKVRERVGVVDLVLWRFCEQGGQA